MTEECSAWNGNFNFETMDKAYCLSSPWEKIKSWRSVFQWFKASQIYTSYL